MFITYNEIKILTNDIPKVDSTIGWKAGVALVSNGFDKTYCAWCRKDVKDIKNLGVHLSNHARKKG